MIFTESQPKYSVLDLGFDKTLVKISSIQDISDVPPELTNVFTSGVASKNLLAGELLEFVDTGQAGISGLGDLGSEIRFWAGDTFDNRASAPFSVNMAGVVKATKISASNVVLYEAVVSADGYGDYTTIQDAIDADKRRIFIRSGTYEVTSAIIIKLSDTYLIGESWQNAIIKLSSTVSSATNVIEVGYGTEILQNVQISNIQINGNRSVVGANGKNGIYCNPNSLISFLTIKDCYIHSCKISNVDLYNSAVSMVNRCYIESAGSREISLEGAYGAFITNNLITCYVDGICIIPSLLTTSDRNIVSGNFLSGAGGNGNLIVIAGSDYNLVENNVIYRATYSGIIINGGTNNIVQGNLIYRNGYHGVLLQGTERNVVSNNTFDKNGQITNDTYSDILLQDNAAAAHCLRNIINGNTMKCSEARKTKYGIREDDANQDKNIITSNVVTDSVTDQISLQGAASINANNIVT